MCCSFLASLVVATTWHGTAIGAYVRYAPPVFLVLALAVLLRSQAPGGLRGDLTSSQDRFLVMRFCVEDNAAPKSAAVV
jgi:hypothetical protein